MNKFIKNSLITSMIVFATSSTFAADHTVSVGYANMKVDDFKNLKGVNAQYRYETQSPWGAVVSSTYVSGKEDTQYDFDEVEHAKVKYFSLLAGPSYRFNEYVSTYVLVGLAQTKSSYDFYDYGFNIYEHNSLKKTSVAYGVGVSVNPVENIAINLGYEGTRFKGFEDQTAKLNGFNISVGYKF